MKTPIDEEIIQSVRLSQEARSFLQDNKEFRRIMEEANSYGKTLEEAQKLIVENSMLVEEFGKIHGMPSSEVLKIARRLRLSAKDPQSMLSRLDAMILDEAVKRSRNPLGPSWESTPFSGEAKPPARPKGSASSPRPKTEKKRLGQTIEAMEEVPRGESELETGETAEAGPARRSSPRNSI